MSIFDEIKAAVDRGALFLVEPHLPDSSIVRRLYAAPNLYRFLETPQSDQSLEARRRSLQADFDAYIRGDERSVRLKYRQGSGSNMVRLDNSDRETWEFQVRGYRPQTRAFGCFAAKDVFIAFFWKRHDEIKDKNDWEAIKIRRYDEWVNLFFHLPPHSGAKVDDYITRGIPV